MPCTCIVFNHVDFYIFFPSLLFLLFSPLLRLGM
jgi:hypothetical protein